MKSMRYACLSLALTATACGGPDPQEAARSLANELCELSFRCCTPGEVGYYLGPYVRQDECADRLTNSANLASTLVINLSMFENVGVLLPNLQALDRAVAEGRTEVDEDALDACIDYLRNVECNALVDDPLLCTPPEFIDKLPCDPTLLFKGKLDEGDTCSSVGTSFECKEHLVCRTPSNLGTATGACVAPGSAGDFCFSDSECRDDLYCSQLDGTCQEFSQAGEVCAFSDPDDPSPSPSSLLVKCAEGLSCDPVSDTCVAPCERGASCSNDLDCDAEAGLLCVLGRCDIQRGQGLPCADDLHCEGDLRCLPSAAEFGALLCQQPLANGEDCPFGDAGHEDCESGFCNPTDGLYECAAAAAPGEACPTELHQQCDNGYCDNIQNTACSTHAECTITNECDFRFGSSGYCVPHCVPVRNDGQTCINDFECESGECVAGTCRTLPLSDGQGCELDTDCESNYCGVEFPRVCDTLPLPNGTGCNFNEHCESGICFGGVCSQGLTEGAACGDFGQVPCGPELYCDTRRASPECTPILDTGTECVDSLQCRGACVERFGRRICDDTPPLNGLVCDGPATPM